MATPTYTLIDSTVLSTSASSVTFSSITQDYRDLVLVIEGSNDSGSNYSIQTILNDDTGANYSYVYAYGDGSSSYSSTSSTVNFALVSRLKSTGETSSNIVQFLDYSATDKHKNILSRGNADLVMMIANRWANTNAITKISMTSQGSANFESGSTFYLYGIEA